jgi:hypothetical protein
MIHYEDNYWELINKPFPKVRMIGDKISPIQPTKMLISVDFSGVVGITNSYHIDNRGHSVGFDFSSDMQNECHSFKYGINNSWKDITKEEYEKHPHYPNFPLSEDRYYTHFYDIQKALDEVQTVVDYYVSLWERIRSEYGWSNHEPTN